MPYIPPEVVKKAREMDLLTYLKNYEPQELVHLWPYRKKRYCFCRRPTAMPQRNRPVIANERHP